MLITKCYIENFGKHRQFEIDFSLGMNAIIRENGWGKSTLAIFIKAMFYGMPASRKSNFDENDRKKYTPWQSGNYGGYIEFKLDDREYRIERYFGKKESDDTFTLIDLKTNKKSNDYDENIGLSIFGLDADAYERSTFIPQKILSSGLNESLSAKLTNVIHGTDYGDSYEQAVEIINARKRELKNNQNRGELPAVEEKIYEINREIQSLNSAGNTLSQLEDSLGQENIRILDTEKELDSLKKRINTLASNQEVLAKRHIYQDLINTEAEINAKLEEINTILNGKTVSRKDLDEISVLNNKLELLKNNLNDISNNSYLDSKYQELNTYFNKCVPSEDKIKEMILKNEEVKKMARVADSNNTPESTLKPVKLIIPTILAIVLVIIGVAMINRAFMVSIVSFVLSGVVLIAMILYISLKKMRNQYVDTNEVTSIDSTAELEIREFVSIYEKINSPYDIHLYNIMKKASEYKDITIQMKDRIDKINTIKSDIASVDEKIISFFSNFDLESAMDNVEKINTLRQIIIEYESLIRQKNDNTAKIQNIKSSMDKIPAVEDEDVSKLQSREQEILAILDERKANKNRLVNQINRYRDEISKISNLENDLVSLQEKKQELDSEMKLLKLTTEYLDKAQDAISAKYLSPMKNAFDKYMNMLAVNDKDYYLDTELNVSVVELGKSREIDYLSKGYQSVVDLCVRFALIDTLFTQEKPFIILDDPFVNMDKDKVGKSLELLRKVANDYQIIYLACHESRV